MFQYFASSTAAPSFYIYELKRKALAMIPVEWHYLIVGWAQSAE